MRIVSEGEGRIGYRYTFNTPLEMRVRSRRCVVDSASSLSILRWRCVTNAPQQEQVTRREIRTFNTPLEMQYVAYQLVRLVVKLEAFNTPLEMQLIATSNSVRYRPLFFQYSVGDAATEARRRRLRNVVAFNTPLEMQIHLRNFLERRALHLSILRWRCAT